MPDYLQVKRITTLAFKNKGTEVCKHLYECVYPLQGHPKDISKVIDYV